VVRFAVDERDKGFLTPQYSFALEQNFRPERDYQANIRAVRQPLRVLAGQNDEVFYADKFASVFKTAGKDVPITLLPGIDHISLTLDQAALQAAISAVESMDHERLDHAMERTSTRRMFTFQITKSFSRRSAPALVGGRSSCSR